MHDTAVITTPTQPARSHPATLGTVLDEEVNDTTSLLTF